MLPGAFGACLQHPSPVLARIRALIAPGNTGSARSIGGSLPLPLRVAERGLLQVNLKQTVVLDNSQTFVPPADLRAGDVFAQLQQLADVQQGQSLITSSTVLQRPRLGLSFLPVRPPDAP